jgi:carbamate kinase
LDAVIDKNFATGLLASHIHADLMVISTGVPNVCVNFFATTRTEKVR